MFSKSNSLLGTEGTIFWQFFGIFHDENIL